MKIKATKTMATALNKAMKNLGYKVSLEKFTERQFALYVDIDSYKHDADYNIEDGTFNVLKVEYPQNYYACNRYITTRDLVRAYKNSNQTYDGFIQAVIESIEI